MQSIFHRPNRSQKVPNPDCTVSIVGQFSKDWQCVPQSSNYYGAWLSCWKRKVVFSGLTLEVWAFSLVSIMIQWSELMVYLSFRKSRRITSFLSQETVYNALPAKGCVLNFFFSEEFTHCHSTDCLFDCGSQWCLHISSLVMMQSRNCLLQPHIGSIGPDKLACGILSVPVWAFVGPTWHKLCDVLPIVAIVISKALQEILCSVHSSLVVIRWFTRMSWSGHSSFHVVTAAHGHLERSFSSTLLFPLLKLTTHCLIVVTFTVQSPEALTKCHEGQVVLYFPHGGIHFHTFASYALPCQMPFCLTASLLPSATRQWHVMEY